MAGTAVVKQTSTQLVVEGAGLNAEVWQPARVAALQKLLPEKFRGDIENLIALASLVDRTGLDPFIKELYAWEDKGRITYHVGRDGWLKIAVRDPNIRSVVSGVIHANDAFSYGRDDDGKIHLQHEGGFPQGDLLGAYAVVRLVEGPDQIVTRELTYFKHLLKKDNWQNYPAEMLETRCLATAIKFVSPLAAGLYAAGEAPDDDYAPAPKGVSATQRRAKTITLPPEAVQVEIAAPGPQEVTEAAEEPVEEPASESYPCPYCLDSFSAPQGLASHSRKHRAEKELEARRPLPAGYRVRPDEDGYYAIDEGTGEMWGPFDTWMAAYDELQSAEGVPEEVSPEPEAAPEEKPAEPPPVQPWTLTRIHKLCADLGVAQPEMMKFVRERFEGLTPDGRSTTLRDLGPDELEELAWYIEHELAS